MSTRLHQSRRRTDYQAGLSDNVTDSARRGKKGKPCLSRKLLVSFQAVVDLLR